MEPTGKGRKGSCPQVSLASAELDVQLSLLPPSLPSLHSPVSGPASSSCLARLPCASPGSDPPSHHSFLTASYLSFKNQLGTLLLEEAFCDRHHVGLHVLAVGAQRTLHTFILAFTVFGWNYLCLGLSLPLHYKVFVKRVINSP